MIDLQPGPNPTPSQAKCGTCHQTFSGVTLFDRHRSGGECADPREMNQIRLDPRGVWRSDQPNDRFPVIQRVTDGRTVASA